MLTRIRLSAVIFEGNRRGRTSHGLSSPQLTRRGGGQAMVFTVAPSDSGAFLCEAENTIGFQRSRPVPLLAAATTGEEPEGALLRF